MPQNNDPDRSIPFLIHELARLVHRTYDQRMKPLGITQAQWRVLASLSFKDGISQSELADSIEHSTVALGGLLDRLEENGWIARRPDPADRRAKKVYLMAKAEDVIGVMRGVADDMTEGLLAGISATDIDRLVTLMNILKQNLQALDGNLSGQTAEGSARRHAG